MTYYNPDRNNGTTIFVFGSNEAGFHGAGAAREAVLHWDARVGVAVGRTGFSYAIPTKNKNIRTLPLWCIAAYVLGFLAYAKEHQELTFLVTRIGCGLAGYTDEAIAPMFKNPPTNCVLPEEWTHLISVKPLKA